MLRIYYNPKCSKSRAALERLENAGLTPEVINYLKNPPQQEQLETLVDKLIDPSVDLLREAPAAKQLRDADVVAALLASPETMQRPVIEQEARAIIARSPERLDGFLGIEDTAE